ncbi:MAG TPA: hypothetical protein VHL57_09315 [Flavobacteriales bacterium]|jgi:hypothetical protein|nr:hypothetical protein [Flavobacteriales bacterium]
MKPILLAAAFCAATALSAQTPINNSAYTFSTGVCPVFCVSFPKSDKKAVENWYRGQLKPISADMTNKKELTAIGVRMPEVSPDTIRVLLQAQEGKRDEPVMLNVAFRVNNAYVGPDSDPRQLEGCRNWMYQHAVMFKKELAQRDLDEGIKVQTRLENDLAGLVKEKDRMHSNMEKTKDKGVEAGQDKVKYEGDLRTLQTAIEAKRTEVGATPSAENTEHLNTMLKDQEKLQDKAKRAADQEQSSKKKVDDLDYQIKKNLEDQDKKAKAIDEQKKVVDGLRTVLAAVN